MVEQRLKDLWDLTDLGICRWACPSLPSGTQLSPFESHSKKVTGPMSTIPTPTSIPEALDLIDDALTYFETADFMAMSVEARLEYLEALDQITAITRVFKAQAMTEYIRRRWDGTVRWAFERPMTGSLKVTFPLSARR
jgi:hypothetical protein